ncbi:MAG: hypothetical protein WBC91_17640, partial [Phototrophicaceae bacterium]
MRLANYYLNPTLAFTFIIFAATGYLLSYFLPTAIIMWDITLVLSAIISLGITLKFVHVEKEEQSSSVLQQILSLIPYVIFIPSILLFLNSPELQISYHGDLHASYVNQIIHGVGQPDNSYLPGTPATYYWLFHALIAAISHLFSIPHPLASAILNVVILLSLFGWTHRILKLIISKQYPPIVDSMMVIFVVFGMNLLGSIQSMIGLWDNFSIWRILQIMAPISISDPRLETVYAKFINYNSFPLALLYSWIMIFAALKIVKKQATSFDVSLFILGIAGGTAFLFISGVVMLATLGGAIVATWILMQIKGELVLDSILPDLNQLNRKHMIPIVVSSISLLI